MNVAAECRTDSTVKLISFEIKKRLKFTVELRQVDYLGWAESHGLRQLALVDNAANGSSQSLKGTKEAGILSNEGKWINQSQS